MPFCFSSRIVIRRPVANFAMPIKKSLKKMFIHSQSNEGYAGSCEKLQAKYRKMLHSVDSILCRKFRTLQVAFFHNTTHVSVTTFVLVDSKPFPNLSGCIAITVYVFYAFFTTFAFWIKQDQSTHCQHEIISVSACHWPVGLSVDTCCKSSLLLITFRQETSR